MLQSMGSQSRTRLSDGTRAKDSTAQRVAPGGSCMAALQRQLEPEAATEIGAGRHPKERRQHSACNLPSTPRLHENQEKNHRNQVENSSEVAKI